MNILEEMITNDPKVKAELRRQMVAILKTIEFTSKFKRAFLGAVERDLTTHIDSLMEDAWDELQDQCVKYIKKNFKLVLERTTK